VCRQLISNNLYPLCGHSKYSHPITPYLAGPCMDYSNVGTVAETTPVYLPTSRRILNYFSSPFAYSIFYILNAWGYELNEAIHVTQFFRLDLDVQLRLTCGRNKTNTRDSRALTTPDGKSRGRASSSPVPFSGKEHSSHRCQSEPSWAPRSPPVRARSSSIDAEG
jgi:hypothetical protein